MGYAERLAAAVGTDDLGWSDRATKPVDYVSALASATGLGSDILRSKTHDQSALHRAILQLAAIARKHGSQRKLPVSEGQAHALAKMALIELIRPHCRVCNGAGQVVLGELKVICPSCEGIAVHRYSDHERARLTGIPFKAWGKWQSRYLMVLRIAQNHDCAEKLALARMG